MLKYLLYCFSFYFVLGSLSADEIVKCHENYVEQEKERGPGLEKEKKLQRMKDRIEEELENQGKDSEESEEKIKQAPVFIGAIHYLYARSWDSSWVEFEDGTSWKTRWEDRPLIKEWLPTDRLVISQAGWFKAFNYVITNTDRAGEEIYVDHQSIPTQVIGSYTRYVKAVDFNLGMVWLNDASCWMVYSKDSSYLYDWHPGEIVIIGVNKGWAQDTAPYILINGRLEDYVRASLY